MPRKTKDKAKAPEAKAKLPTDPHIAETMGLPSASRFDSYFRCMGKRALENLLPPEPDNRNTIRGHGIHGALERSDLSGLSKSDAITASRCMYAEAEIIHQHGFEGAEVHWEKRLWDMDEDFKPAWSAKLDALHILGKRALVMDYKTGFGMTQPIERNWQVGGQAALARSIYGVEEVVGGLIHPHHPESLHETVVFSAAKLDQSLVTIRGKIEAINLPEQPRTPNAISCQYCRAKNVCPEFKARMEKLAKDVLDESKDEGFTKLINRTPADRGRHIKNLKMVEVGITALMDQYKKLLASGDKADGWHLVKSWIREITDDALAITLTRNAWGDEAVSSALQFNIVALQDYLAKTRTKTAAKADAEEVLKDVLKFKTKKAALKETVI